MRVCDSYIKGFTRFFTVSKFLLKSIKQTKKERISDSNTVGQPQAEKLPTRKLRKRIIKLTILLLSERQSNHLLWTKTSQIQAQEHCPTFPQDLMSTCPLFITISTNQQGVQNQNITSKFKLPNLVYPGRKRKSNYCKGWQFRFPSLQFSTETS